MKRPLLAGLIFLIAGVMSGRYVNDSVFIILLFILASAATLALIFLHKKTLFCVLILFYIMGYISINSAQAVRNNLAEEAAISFEIVEVSGLVEDVSENRILIAANRVTLNDRTDQNPVNIRAFLETDEELRIGQHITVSGRLIKPEGLRNEGGFNQFQHFAARNIQYRMNATLVSTGGTTITIRGITNRFKNRLIEIYESSLPPSESGIIIAMLLGDRTGIDERIAELYRVGGIYHILAISGLHITAIAFLLDFLLKKQLGTVNSGIATLIILCFYAVFTGLAISTMRAVIMFGVHVIGRVLWRKNDLLSSTALAACILLIMNPFNLWDGGFLLSFSSVFGIGFGANTIRQTMYSLPKESLAAKAVKRTRFFSDGIPASLAVTLFNTPIVASVFYQVPIYGIIANLIIVPTVIFVLIGGIIVGIAGFISIHLSSFLGGALFFIFQFYEFICVTIERLPFAMFITGRVPLHYILLWYVMSASVLMFLKSSRDNRRFYVRCTLGAILALVIAFGIDGINSRNSNYVVKLDVGQGDSIVIRNNGITFLVDGGDPWNANEILSHMRSKRIGKIDGVFVTHPDSDHIGGIIPLIGRINIGSIYMPPNVGAIAELEIELIERAEMFGVPVVTLTSGDKVLFPGGEIVCLHPTPNFSSNRNANSLVLMYETLGIRFLLTGDIGIEEERRILRDFDCISSHVLNLAHHGSAFSNSEQFLLEVSPEIAFVGTGRRNPHGHPSGRVVQLLYEMDIPLFNTAETGQITFYISRDSDIKVRTMR